jgi:hypothetical protein
LDRFISSEPWALPRIMAILLVILGVFGILAPFFQGYGRYPKKTPFARPD